MLLQIFCSGVLQKKIAYKKILKILSIFLKKSLIKKTIKIDKKNFLYINFFLTFNAFTFMPVEKNNYSIPFLRARYHKKFAKRYLFKNRLYKYNKFAFFLLQLRIRRYAVKKLIKKRFTRENKRFFWSIRRRRAQRLLRKKIKKSGLRQFVLHSNFLHHKNAFRVLKKYRNVFKYLIKERRQIRLKKITKFLRYKFKRSRIFLFTRFRKKNKKYKSLLLNLRKRYVCFKRVRGRNYVPDRKRDLIIKRNKALKRILKKKSIKISRPTMSPMLALLTKLFRTLQAKPRNLFLYRKFRRKGKYLRRLLRGYEKSYSFFFKKIIFQKKNILKKKRIKLRKKKLLKKINFKFRKKKLLKKKYFKLRKKLLKKNFIKKNIFRFLSLKKIQKKILLFKKLKRVFNVFIFSKKKLKKKLKIYKKIKKKSLFVKMFLTKKLNIYRKVNFFLSFGQKLNLKRLAILYTLLSTKNKKVFLQFQKNYLTIIFFIFKKYKKFFKFVKKEFFLKSFSLKNFNSRFYKLQKLYKKKKIFEKKKIKRFKRRNVRQTYKALAKYFKKHKRRGKKTLVFKQQYKSFKKLRHVQANIYYRPERWLAKIFKYSTYVHPSYLNLFANKFYRQKYRKKWRKKKLLKKINNFFLLSLLDNLSFHKNKNYLFLQSTRFFLYFPEFLFLKSRTTPENNNLNIFNFSKNKYSIINNVRLKNFFTSKFYSAHFFLKRKRKKNLNYSKTLFMRKKYLFLKKNNIFSKKNSILIQNNLINSKLLTNVILKLILKKKLKLFSIFNFFSHYSYKKNKKKLNFYLFNYLKFFYKKKDKNFYFSKLFYIKKSVHFKKLLKKFYQKKKFLKLFFRVKKTSYLPRPHFKKKRAYYKLKKFPIIFLKEHARSRKYSKLDKLLYKMKKFRIKKCRIPKYKRSLQARFFFYVKRPLLISSTQNNFKKNLLQKNLILSDFFFSNKQKDYFNEKNKKNILNNLVYPYYLKKKMNNTLKQIVHRLKYKINIKKNMFYKNKSVTFNKIFSHVMYKKNIKNFFNFFYKRLLLVSKFYKNVNKLKIYYFIKRRFLKVFRKKKKFMRKIKLFTFGKYFKIKNNFFLKKLYPFMCWNVLPKSQKIKKKKIIKKIKKNIFPKFKKNNYKNTNFKKHRRNKFQIFKIREALIKKMRINRKKYKLREIIRLKKKNYRTLHGFYRTSKRKNKISHIRIKFKNRLLTKKCQIANKLEMQMFLEQSKRNTKMFVNPKNYFFKIYLRKRLKKIVHKPLCVTKLIRSRFYFKKIKNLRGQKKLIKNNIARILRNNNTVSFSNVFQKNKFKNIKNIFIRDKNTNYFVEQLKNKKILLKFKSIGPENNKQVILSAHKYFKKKILNSIFLSRKTNYLNYPRLSSYRGIYPRLLVPDKKKKNRTRRNTFYFLKFFKHHRVSNFLLKLKKKGKSKRERRFGYLSRYIGSVAQVLFPETGKMVTRHDYYLKMLHSYNLYLNTLIKYNVTRNRIIITKSKYYQTLKKLYMEITRAQVFGFQYKFSTYYFYKLLQFKKVKANRVGGLFQLRFNLQKFFVLFYNFKKKKKLYTQLSLKKNLLKKIGSYNLKLAINKKNKNYINLKKISNFSQLISSKNSIMNTKMVDFFISLDDLMVSPKNNQKKLEKLKYNYLKVSNNKILKKISKWEFFYNSVLNSTSSPIFFFKLMVKQKTLLRFFMLLESQFNILLFRMRFIPNLRLLPKVFFYNLAFLNNKVVRNPYFIVNLYELMQVPLILTKKFYFYSSYSKLPKFLMKEKKIFFFFKLMQHIYAREAGKTWLPTYFCVNIKIATGILYSYPNFESFIQPFNDFFNSNKSYLARRTFSAPSVNNQKELFNSRVTENFYDKARSHRFKLKLGNKLQKTYCITHLNFFRFLNYYVKIYE